MPCSVSARVCNAEGIALWWEPLYVVLEVGGIYLFGPSFSTSPQHYAHLLPAFAPGKTEVGVVASFTWPGSAGSGSATWYAALVEPEIGGVIGAMGTWAFSWGEPGS